MRLPAFSCTVITLAAVTFGLVATVDTSPAPTSAAHHKQSAFVHLTNPTLVDGHVLPEGGYLIVHDERKMANGEPCTSFFCFDAERGWSEVVSFQCNPVDREPVDRITLTMVPTTPGEPGGTIAVDKLIEYQFAGETEGHGVPEERFVAGPNGSATHPHAILSAR
jgi:hypothetical protein